MGPIRQYCAKTVVAKERRSSSNGGHTRTNSHEGSTVYLVGLLDRSKLVIDQKRPELAYKIGVVIHQDNARPHTSVVTRQKLSELGWEIFMHPPYSPDLAPSDYYLFLALQNFLSDKKLGESIIRVFRQ
ncbi:histone-lysine N-methyltransferase SETMAR [Trichonephila clavipes]|nr:histone-lysine N-methyltransferase SETMAR [Trichonephila clavipes]